MFLAVMFLISVCSMSISATEASGTGTGSDSEEAFEPVTYTYNTNSAKPTIGYFATKTNGTTYDSPLAEKGLAVLTFKTPEEKIATMDLRLQKDGYQIRHLAIENNISLFTSLDTVKILLDVLEEITLTISTIDA